VGSKGGAAEMLVSFTMFLLAKCFIDCGVAPADVQQVRIAKGHKLAGAMFELCACYHP